MSGSELYAAWLMKYSPTGDPGEALDKVRKEVDTLMKEQPPPLEVRVAAMEQFTLIWSEFLLSMLYVDQMPDMDPVKIVTAAISALEFLRLAALAQAIELDRLANEGDESK